MDSLPSRTLTPLTFHTRLGWGADCPGADAHKLPVDTPVIWPYVTGTPGVIWPEDQIARFTRAKVYRVNQGYQSPSPFHGDEFDVESGAWSPQEVAGIVAARRQRMWSTRLYGTYATYDQTVSLLAERGLRASTYWRIADWSLDQHLADAELWGDVYAGQWASPTSNPGMTYPGTALDLTEMNADLSVLLIEDTGWRG